MDSSILQSIIRFNADKIMASQCFYQSFRDFSKNAFHAGNKDVHQKYLGLARKELRKLHLLERNQRELLDELAFAYQHEDFERLLEVENTAEDYARYQESEWD